MEAEFISEIFVLMYQISLRPNPDDHKLNHIHIDTKWKYFKYETYQLQLHYQNF